MVNMIGLQREELSWVRLLVNLLRHPDSSVGQLARIALLHTQEAAADAGLPGPEETCKKVLLK